MSRKIPRGKGYDKAAVLGHVKKMAKDGIAVTAYVKQAKLHLDTFILAVNKYGLGETAFEIAQDPKLIHAKCEYCQDDFWPSRKARFCSSYCGNMSRKDKEYFGGNRKLTVGLLEGVCQLCERTVAEGLSSHHIYGKANDEANAFLLALCKGCHAIVSDLALKTWCDQPEKLQKLIWLAITQRQGARWIKDRADGWGFFVNVELLACAYANQRTP